MLLRPNRRIGELEGKTGQGFGGWAASKPPDRLGNAQPEGLADQPFPQGAVEQGLPRLGRRQGWVARVAGEPLLPGPQQVGAVEGVVIEGVGDGPPQPPAADVEAAHEVAIHQPAAQGFCFGAGGDLGKQFQQRPDQLMGAPGIRIRGWGAWVVWLRRIVTSIPVAASTRSTSLPQPAAGEGEADVGDDAAQMDGQLFPQPAAGGPGVDHHLHLLEGIGRGEAQLGGQQLGEQFSPVAAVDGQQGMALGLGTPLTLTTWPVSGQ